jgi:hypothetical protein
MVHCAECSVVNDRVSRRWLNAMSNFHIIVLIELMKSIVDVDLAVPDKKTVDIIGLIHIKSRKNLENINPNNGAYFYSYN